jgi:hypothetical protein
VGEAEEVAFRETWPAIQHAVELPSEVIGVVAAVRQAAYAAVVVAMAEAAVAEQRQGQGQVATVEVEPGHAAVELQGALEQWEQSPRI